LFVEDSDFETMNTYFPEEILNMQTEFKEQNYNERFLTGVSRRKATINTNNKGWWASTGLSKTPRSRYRGYIASLGRPRKF
jgi:hypothetical protein